VQGTAGLVLRWKDRQVDKPQDDPECFNRHVGPENPVFLWIGSAESRAVAERITRSLPGSLYLHRTSAIWFPRATLT
jgi:carbonic anhydrase